MKTTFALTMMLLFAGCASAQDRLTDTLRKGVVEEESQHNLAAAVADYQRVVAQFDEDRKTAATALFRLAECERKLHHDEQAKAAYQRVVREFADQARVAEQSRAVLASNYKVTSATLNAYFQTVEFDPKLADAKQRYRNSLLASIELSKGNMSRMQKQYELGVVGPESLEASREVTLKLERELAAFDMGIVPTGNGGR